MRAFRRLNLSALACLGAVCLVAMLATVSASIASPNETLAEINRYFNTIRTMKGQFVQFGPNGGRTEGQFAIQRPGRVRFHYNRPSTLDVIADGKSIAVRDRKLATQDIWPLDRTPLRFLLADNIDLTQDANITKVELKPDLVVITIEESTVFGDGTLVLMFDSKTYELKQWNVIDGQGQETSVSIYNVATGVPVQADLFEIDYTRILK